MENKMFCFQCQETRQNLGCTTVGMCGKRAEVANLMDELIRELKRLALTQKPSRELGLFVTQSLFMTITNANFDPARIQAQIARAKELTGVTNATAPLGVLSCPDEEIRSLRELLTYGVKGIAAYADHAAMLGKVDEEIYEFIFKALAATAEEHTAEELTALAAECGKTAVKAMALLGAANTEAFGNPEITKVRTSVGKRPGILVSGHDLRDLQELLEQSKDAGIDVYTHGEMLPAHSYPAFKKYPHLFGNYGNAWHLQDREFTAFGGPVLMTTNCITPVQAALRITSFPCSPTSCLPPSAPAPSNAS